MQTSRKLTYSLLALFALVVMSASANAADPGLKYPPTSQVSDQKAGSVLYYNYYTSGGQEGAQNTRINITNTSSTSPAFVHLFFVASDCSVADNFICLTALQTASFLASDVDPATTGYIVAIAVDGVVGCPVAFNHLIGDEYARGPNGHTANLGAEAFAALFNGILAGCDGNSVTAILPFNGVVGAGYNCAPRVLALDNVGSRANGNDTLLIINRVGGNLATGASTTGTIFGWFFDDAENAFSYTFPLTGCQVRGILSDTFPRTAPRLSVVIPSGRSGWTKFYNLNSDVGLLGASINKNESVAALNGGHNLHKLTLSCVETLTIPIFPPSC